MGARTPSPVERPELRCPRCHGRDIVPSLPRHFLDEIMRGWGRVPKHCRGCGKRFYARDSGRPTPDQE